MKRLFTFALLLSAWFFPAALSGAQEPLRVFIRSGPKTHGPGAHDHPRFLREWVPLLNERGARATGGNAFPTAAQLADTDVLVLHAQEAGNISDPAERAGLDAFLARGGGLVVIHAGLVSRDPDWFKGIIGGAWRQGTAKWLEGPMHLYFTDRDSPLTKDVSNWEMDDEIYYDLEIAPEAKILAAAYTPKAAGAVNANAQKRADELTAGGKRVSIYDVQPQMWTYEKIAAGGRTPYRAFVSIPGHLYENFNRPNYRALLLRGIAWAGQRNNVDELCRPSELGDNLRYVAGGPTRPAEAAAKIEVHPEFKLSLVAAEPLIQKVMSIDWDERGRLWVAETPEYPNGRRVNNTTPWKDTGSLRPGNSQREPTDRISILTDTDGDGIMDAKHVFADKLELVSGFVLYRNGVIAATSPDIWYLEDTNGDGVADKRTRLYTGLGINDTHAVINNLRWGQDGWVYATHGYSRGEVTSPDGKTNFGPDGSGVVRFKPDGSAFEQYSSRGGNTWGLDITWDGQVFWTQPTSNTVLFHTVLPEAILAKGKLPGVTSWKGMITDQKTFPAMTRAEQAYVQIDLVGRFTAAAGCAIYEGGAWPARWNYSYFTTEPTINLVHHQFVKPDGVTYTSHKETGREETEFMRSTDLWFRPIETRIGPDGALYVVDFYNQAVIHNDTRGPQHSPANAAIRPDRDHYFGRIWRVQHREATKLPMPPLDRLKADTLVRAIETSPNATVKQIAWRLLRENHSADPRYAALQKPMGSPAEALYWHSRDAATAPQRAAVLAGFAEATDNWSKSALVAAAADHATDYIVEAVAQSRPEKLSEFVTALLPATRAGDEERLLTAAAAAGSNARPLSLAILRHLGETRGRALTMNDRNQQALLVLLKAPETAAAALPLISKWDATQTLANDAAVSAGHLRRDLDDATIPAERRAEIARSLIAIPDYRGDALQLIGSLLEDPRSSDRLKEQLMVALGDDGGADVAPLMVAALVRTPTTPFFNQIVKRAEPSLALISALRKGEITVASLGTGNVARLRTHPNLQVSQQATALLQGTSASAQQKAEIIAALTPAVIKPGNITKGRELFAVACATCHKFDSLGQRDVGPPLTGMGAHGPAELLVHVVDPNREVDPSYWQWNVTTKKGENVVGVIVNENATSLTLRHSAGDVEVKKADIATQENTRRSLMPEGFDGLGAEPLRDLLAYLCAQEQNFRVVDLRDVYNADSRRGAFTREDARDQTVSLKTFGNVTVHGVPFFIMDPAKSSRGANFIALKGGTNRSDLSTDYPRRVEIPVNAIAASLHFLGGIGAGAYPTGGDSSRGKAVEKLTVNFADGSIEEHVFRNGEHFASATERADVPLSAAAGDLTRQGQLRTFAVNLKTKGLVKRVALESFDNEIVPCTVAITAGADPVATPKSTATAPVSTVGPKAGGKGDAPLPAPTIPAWEPGKTKVLLISGGSSHKFAEFFGGTDSATLHAAGFSVHYTEDRDQAAVELADADVAVISVNRQFFDTPAYREALLAFAAAGKGIVMLHPGTWYGFAQWPELNAQIVGGGSRGHDKLGPYQVKAVQPEHPILRGVPATFDVVDELYYINAEPEKIPTGTAPITVLAESSPSLKYGKPHPVVWVTQHPDARVVGLTLGHDERVHDLDAFKQLLTNAVRWAAGPRSQAASPPP
ncbi:MAG: PVC-type heme-binding CxxCH protein [Opitutus sp.]